MQPRRRWFLVAIGVLLLLFGLGCLNYTEAEGREHHRRQAERYGLPEPSRNLFRVGVVCTAIGAELAGFGVARRIR